MSKPFDEEEHFKKRVVTRISVADIDYLQDTIAFQKHYKRQFRLGNIEGPNLNPYFTDEIEERLDAIALRLKGQLENTPMIDLMGLEKEYSNMTVEEIYDKAEQVCKKLDEKYETEKTEH